LVKPNFTKKIGSNIENQFSRPTNFINSIGFTNVTRSTSATKLTNAIGFTDFTQNIRVTGFIGNTRLIKNFGVWEDIT